MVKKRFVPRPERSVSLKCPDLKDSPPDFLWERWPAEFVRWYDELDSSAFPGFQRVLDEAKDERPLQEFLTKYRLLLALALPVSQCCIFPKPRLGGGTYIPDFLVCEQNSLGYGWTLIELESPKIKATNKDKSVSSGCHCAVQQILDYRRWLHDNALFESKQGFEGLHADCQGWVWIGRRDRARTQLEGRAFGRL